MRKIFISSDHHLFHDNILKFTDKAGNLIRPGFSNVNEMNEYILEKHNSIVSPQDIWYCLGDITMKNTPEFLSLIKKFNGSKRLIVGNHDNIKYLVKENIFQKVQMWRMFPEFKCTLSHVPLNENSLYRGNPENNITSLNIHGHIHQNNSPEGQYKNVCLEAINYTPVLLEEISSNYWSI